MPISKKVNFGENEMRALLKETAYIKGQQFFSQLTHTHTHTHTHTCVCHYRVPGDIKRREVELDPQPKRDHEQGGGAGLRKLEFFRFELFVNSSAKDIVFVTLPKHGS